MGAFIVKLNYCCIAREFAQGITVTIGSIVLGSAQTTHRITVYQD